MFSVIYHLLDCSGKLIRTRCTSSAAVYVFEQTHDFFRIHALYQRTYSGSISGTSACKSRFNDYIVAHGDINRLGANPLVGLVGYGLGHWSKANLSETKIIFISQRTNENNNKIEYSSDFFQNAYMTIPAAAERTISNMGFTFKNEAIRHTAKIAQLHASMKLRP